MPQARDASSVQRGKPDSRLVTLAGWQTRVCVCVCVCVCVRARMCVCARTPPCRREEGYHCSISQAGHSGDSGCGCTCPPKACAARAGRGRSTRTLGCWLHSTPELEMGSSVIQWVPGWGGTSSGANGEGSRKIPTCNDSGGVRG